MPAVRVEKLATVDAFVVFDLEEAETAWGVVRSAPKILVDGAIWLARTRTYQLASFELRIGGASAGINAQAADVDAAVERFVEEVRPWVAAHRFLPDPGRGVSLADLELLRSDDPRGAGYFEHRDALTALGLAEAGSTALGGLDGRRAAVECFDAVGPLLIDELVERGAKVVAVGTAKGTVVSSEGLDPAQVAGCWAQYGPELVEHLGRPISPAADLPGVEVDGLFLGSKAGLLDHHVAGGVRAGVVVPTGPVPVTAKALAILRRRGIEVLPDFVTTAGSLFGAPSVVGVDATSSEVEVIRDLVTRRISEVLAEVRVHEDGALLAACYRAESFLRTWCHQLPFGRPLA